MSLGLSLQEEVYDGLPPGTFYRIDGVDSLRIDDWYELASLPGAFVPMTHGPVKAASKELERWRLQHGCYPPVVAVPSAQWAVARRKIDELCRRNGYPSPPTPPSLREKGWNGLPFPPRLPEGIDSSTGAAYGIYPYQIEAIRKFVGKQRMTVEIPPGTGKTLIAYAAAEHLRRATRNIDRAVVIAPRMTLTEVWLDKLAQYYPEASALLVEGSPAQRKTLFDQYGQQPVAYVLTTYDFWRSKQAEAAARLFLGPRTLVILDEVHNVKHVDTERWKTIRKALDDGPNGTVPWRLLMTGTMVDDKPWDLFGPIQLLGLRTWNSWTEFRDRYFQVEQAKIGNMPMPQYTYITGFKSTEMAQELQSVRRELGFVRTEEELGIRLPERRPDPHKVRMTAAEERIYRDILKAARDDLTLAGVLASMTAESEFADDPHLLLRSESATAKSIFAKVPREQVVEMAPGSKFRSFSDWLQNYLNGESGKVVVFSRFVGMIETFRTRYEDPIFCQRVGIPGDIGKFALYAHGQLSSRENNASFERFLNDPEKRVYFSSDAGSQGLNYQSVSRVVVHYDEPYRMSTLDQREGRVRRMDQVARSVLYPYFYVEASGWLEDELATLGESGSIDQRIRVLIDEKRQMRRQMEGS